MSIWRKISRMFRSAPPAPASARLYSAARAGHSDGGAWRTLASASAPASYMSGIDRVGLRAKMRALVRLNPHAASAVDTLVNHIVGKGIIPRAKTGADKLDRTVDELFQKWSVQSQAGGSNDFYGLQSLICRTMVVSGEVLIRRRPRRSADGLVVPLQLQVLEPDFIDDARSSLGDGGRQISGGIEYDALQNTKAYWLFAMHPDDDAFRYGAFANVSRRVRASDIAHVFETHRPQSRGGVPWGASALHEIERLAGYEDAESVRKRSEACLVGIVFGDDEAKPGVGPSVKDKDGETVEYFEPGLIAYAHHGKDVKFTQPAASGGYEEYRRAHLKTIAAGFRIPYEKMSGDLSQVNYSSIRAGSVDFSRMIGAAQEQIMIQLFCRPAWKWFTEAAYAAGLIPSPDVDVEWGCPKTESVDPLKDAAAKVMLVRAGIMSLADVHAGEGKSSADVLKDIFATNAQLDGLGLTLDSDPRRVTKSGGAQAVAFDAS